MACVDKLLRFLSSLGRPNVSNNINHFHNLNRSGKINHKEIPKEVIREFEPIQRPQINHKLSPKIEDAVLKLMKGVAYRLLRAFPGGGVLAESVRSAICRKCGVHKTYQEIELALKGFIESKMINGRRMVKLEPQIIQQMYLDWELSNILAVEVCTETVILCEFPVPDPDNKHLAQVELNNLRSKFVRLSGVQRVITTVSNFTDYIPIVIVTHSRERAEKIKN
eukprot:UN34360